MSCGDRLTRNVAVFSQKSWRNSSLSSTSTDGRQERQTSGEGHGFLSIVFTCASKSSIHCRMATACDVDVDPADAASLNEVCLNVKPCDVVFSGSVLASLLSLFTLPAQQNSSERSPHLLDSQTRLPFLTSSSLPLIYVNAHNFRLLVPASSAADAAKLDRHCRTLACGDVCIFHIGSVTIVPRAVNPLARLIVNKSLYSRALHSGMTNRIGSEIEDRQYQMDISGLGVSTGHWNELIVDENHGSSLVTGVTSENPALAWNMLSNVRYACCFCHFL